MRWATDYDCIDADGQRIIRPLWIDCSICRAKVRDVVHGVAIERIIVIRPPVRICKEDVISVSGIKWTVELEPGVWLANGQGDPARTLQPQHAKKFATETAARRALQAARKLRPFANAVIAEGVRL